MIASTLAKQLNTIDVKLPQAEGKTENRKELAMLKHALEWNDMRVSTKNYKDGYSRRSWLTHVRYNTWVALQRKV